MADISFIQRIKNVLSGTNGFIFGAGGTTAGTAPIKLTTQASGLATVEQGALELIGNSLQFSQLVKRRGIMMSQAVQIVDITVDNTTTETLLITAEHGANYLEIGKSEEIFIRGTIQQRNNAAAFLSIRTKYAGTTLLTTTSPTSTAIAAGTPFEIRVTTTCRNTGVSGTMQVNATLWIDGVVNVPDAKVLATINTTIAQNTTITMQWNEANANNIFISNQGRVTCIEPNR